MNKWILNAVGLASLGALLCVGWAAYQVGSTARGVNATIALNAPAIASTVAAAKEGIPDLFAESRDVTMAILKPCKPGKPETCGLIPSIRSVAVSAGAQIAQTQPLLQNAAAAVLTTSGHVNDAVDAAAGATRQARADLLTLNGSIEATKPLLMAYARTGDDLNSILERKAIDQILDHAAGILDSGDGIAADGKKITDKLTTDFLAPQPWWKKAGRYAGDAFDYGALFARHAP